MRSYFGKYRAVCRDNNDPRKVGRIRVEAPAVLGVGPDAWSVWAWPSLPPNVFDVPNEGDMVWVEFEGGDPNSPIWTGVWFKGDGDTSDAFWQEDHPVLTDLTGAEVDWDKTDHTSPTNPLDDFEHKQYHDHVTSFYSPHRRGFFSKTGHSLEFNDHPGTEGEVRFSDRFGRLLEMTTAGITRLRSHFYPAATEEWLDLNGNPVDASHSLTFQDLSQGTLQFDSPFIEMKDMAGARVYFDSTPGQEAIFFEDFWHQRLLVYSANGEEFVELRDKAGQYLKLDAVANVVTVRDKVGNQVELKNGQVTVASNGHVTVNVPTGSNVNLGGTAGQELATKTFVQTYYNTHTHLSGSPGSPTSPPVARAPLTPGTDITKKTKSE